MLFTDAVAQLIAKAGAGWVRVHFRLAGAAVVLAEHFAGQIDLWEV